MAYKILENNAVDNTNIEGAVFNKFVAGKKSGIIEFANNCSLSATGNVLIISTGILMLSGVRVRLTAPESFTVTSAPVVDTRYQVIAQLINTDGENFDFSVFIQDILPLVQNDIVADAGVYQLELGRFTHTTTGEIDDVIRTADILTVGSIGGADFEIGEVTTQMIASGLPAEVDIEKKQIENKTYIDFAFGIPKGIGSNPNLLINGDFAINQRGASSYTGANIYSVDRWQIENTEAATVSVVANGISLVTTLAFRGVRQFIEDKNKLAGKTVTLSLTGTGGTGGVRFALKKRIGGTGSDIAFVDGLVGTTGTITLTTTIPADLTSTDIYVAIYNKTADTSIFNSVKLELGSIATPFVPPLIAEELPKCQRYYQKIIALGGLNLFAFGVLNGTANLRTVIPISVPLRTTPTVVAGGLRSFNFATSTTYTPDGTTAVISASPNQIYLQTLHSVSMGTVGTFMQLFSNTTTDYISFDAEIY